ncbi:hypothetical protein CC85DRAFT_134362 [Cutaneotrichosporon oleaginosum]|uniref:Zn(2)-C6 fungal-type domain-containing protein n=1 Tax=Cutaneotrichosporon oleaginosum TaxID=879819 RepID=A0A0J1BBQ3_9TREE|nr:uncharacterized protein CC85DRAFT_134362 [Cutaneotrichosporon oleaginosum]KLT45424.1 hypothetical protein CC85DRAFT_134362 [Cutaneotrichosporon oleaginosum]TXT14614.1 hypothetical protein COLE_00807 [Cutaneotrichosporon oleaginosum]
MPNASTQPFRQPQPRANRERKIKCTGERPTCANCVKRSFHCHYDAVVKRRGPDKEPGGRLKPRGGFVSQAPRSMGLNLRVHQARSETTTMLRRVSRVASVVPPSLLRVPGDLDQERLSWWEALYANMPRDRVVQLCDNFLKDCDIWFNFFHRGLFFKSFFAQDMGAHIVYGVMAHMMLLREGHTEDGRKRALSFATEAHRMVTYSLTAGYYEPSLAQTALLLVAFEFQPHAWQNPSRVVSALGFMEGCAKTCLPYWSAPATAHLTPTAAAICAIRREEMRQMCWTLSHLAANSTIWRHLARQPPLCLASADPAKFAELFPPNLFDADRKAPKLYGWSLYCAAIRLWHTALNHVPGVHPSMFVCEQAKELLPVLDSAPCSGSRRYLWQAREWVTAARGHVGDLDNESVQYWFHQQKDALKNFEPSLGNGDRKPRPTYAWWYLMVAYTSLQLSAQYAFVAAEAEGVLNRVLTSLDNIVASSGCNNLKTLCNAVRERNNALKTLRAP